MRRSVFLMLLGLALAACGGEVATTAAPDASVVATTTTNAPAVETDAPVDADLADTVRTTTTAVPLPTGREVLAAAQAEGRPVVLWFWGAH